MYSRMFPHLLDLSGEPELGTFTPYDASLKSYAENIKCCGSSIMYMALYTTNKLRTVHFYIVKVNKSYCASWLCNNTCEDYYPLHEAALQFPQHTVLEIILKEISTKTMTTVYTAPSSTMDITCPIPKQKEMFQTKPEFPLHKG